MFMPTDAEIAAEAERLGLTTDSGKVTSQARKAAAKSLIDAQKREHPTEGAVRTLLSRQVVAREPGVHLIFEVWEQKEETAQ